MRAITTDLRNKHVITHLVIIILLGVLIWFARYSLSGKFGLYTDDYSRIPQMATLTFSDLISKIWTRISTFAGQGRPLHESLIYFFSFISWRLGGLKAAYFFSFLILYTNACLFYLFSFTVGNRLFAVVSTLAFSLYFADTTQTLLTHSFGIQTSLLFFLLAANLFVRKKFVLAYVMLALQLLTYEAALLVFLVLPLLLFLPLKKTRQWFVINTAVVFTFLVGSVILRRQIGEVRIMNLSFQNAVRASLVHVVKGGLFNLFASGIRIMDLFKSFSVNMIWKLIPGMILIAILIGFGYQDIFQRRKTAQKNASEDPAAKSQRKMWRMLIAGILMFFLAYAVNFTLQASAINGRDTRVHVAAVFGFAICVGALVCLIGHWIKRKWITGSLVGVVFVLFFGYGIHLQSIYAQSWQLQQEFWTELLTMIQDAGEEKVVLVTPNGINNPVEIEANSWNLPRMLALIYIFPESWEEPPRVYLLGEDWQNSFVVGSNIELNGGSTYAPPVFYKHIEERDIIFIESSDGELRRRQEMLPIGERSIEFLPPGDPILSRLPKNVLWDLLFSD